MGIRLIGCAALALTACAPQGEARDQGSEGAAGAEAAVNDGSVGLQSAQIGELALTLANDGMTCDLVFGEGFVSLELPPPCRFLERGDTGTATVEDYGEAGAIVLVGGPLVALSDYARFNGRKPEEACSYIAQPVIVKNGEVEVGDLLADSQGFCATAAPDEKFYYGLAHPAG